MVIALGQAPSDTQLQTFRKILETGQNNSLAHYRIGEIFFNGHNYQSAANKFREALTGDLEPKWVEVWAHINLGKIFDLTNRVSAPRMNAGRRNAPQITCCAQRSPGRGLAEARSPIALEKSDPEYRMKPGWLAWKALCWSAGGRREMGCCAMWRGHAASGPGSETKRPWTR